MTEQGVSESRPPGPGVGALTHNNGSHRQINLRAKENMGSDDESSLREGLSKTTKISKIGTKNKKRKEI